VRTGFQKVFGPDGRPGQCDRRRAYLATLPLQRAHGAAQVMVLRPKARSNQTYRRPQEVIDCEILSDEATGPLAFRYR
jgi:hypothetical protein